MLLLRSGQITSHRREASNPTTSTTIPTPTWRSKSISHRPRSTGRKSTPRLKVAEIWRFKKNAVVIEHVQPNGTYLAATSSRFLHVRADEVTRWFAERKIDAAGGLDTAAPGVDASRAGAARPSQALPSSAAAFWRQWRLTSSVPHRSPVGIRCRRHPIGSDRWREAGQVGYWQTGRHHSPPSLPWVAYRIGDV